MDSWKDSNSKEFTSHFANHTHTFYERNSFYVILFQSQYRFVCESVHAAYSDKLSEDQDTQLVFHSENSLIISIGPASCPKKEERHTSRFFLGNVSVLHLKDNAICDLRKPQVDHTVLIYSLNRLRRYKFEIL